MSDPYQDEFESEIDPSDKYADEEYDDIDDLDDVGAVGGALGAGAMGMGAGHADQFDDFDFEDDDLAPVAMGFEDEYEDEEEDDDDEELGFLGAAFGSAAAAKMPAEPESMAPQFDSPEAAQLAELINEGPDHPYYSEAIIQRAKLFEKNGDLVAEVYHLGGWFRPQADVQIAWNFGN